MKGWVCLILLPILALIFSINSGHGESVSVQKSDTSINDGASKSRIDHPVSIDQKKDVNKLRHKIRIKALDDFAAVEIVPATFETRRPELFCKPSYWNRVVYIYSSHSAARCLRGPPAIA
jgi:hypothetical protein